MEGMTLIRPGSPGKEANDIEPAGRAVHGGEGWAMQGGDGKIKGSG